MAEREPRERTSSAQEPAMSATEVQPGAFHSLRRGDQRGWAAVRYPMASECGVGGRRARAAAGCARWSDANWFCAVPNATHHHRPAMIEVLRLLGEGAAVAASLAAAGGVPAGAVHTAGSDEEIPLLPSAITGVDQSMGPRALGPSPTAGEPELPVQAGAAASGPAATAGAAGSPGAAGGPLLGPPASAPLDLARLAAAVQLQALAKKGRSGSRPKRSEKERGGRRGDRDRKHGGRRGDRRGKGSRRRRRHRVSSSSRSSLRASAGWAQFLTEVITAAAWLPSTQRLHPDRCPPASMPVWGSIVNNVWWVDEVGPEKAVERPRFLDLVADEWRRVAVEPHEKQNMDAQSGAEVQGYCIHPTRHRVGVGLEKRRMMFQATLSVAQGSRPLVVATERLLGKLGFA